MRKVFVLVIVFFVLCLHLGLSVPFMEKTVPDNSKELVCELHDYSMDKDGAWYGALCTNPDKVIIVSFYDQLKEWHDETHKMVWG